MEKFEQRHGIDLFKAVISEVFEMDIKYISDNPEQKDNKINYNSYREEVNIYELGLYYKEYIEAKAHNLGLRGVWIDLNDLSKDEGYYFRNCYDVFKGLVEYEKTMSKD